MRLRELQQNFHKELGEIYEKGEIDNFFYLLTEYYFNLKRLDLALNPAIEVEKSDVILNGLEDLKQGVPIQYILGETEFYGSQFKVNEHTLIPRPETEELVDWVVKEIANADKELNILDIGTGSGCIAVSLAKHLPGSKVFALDISKEALNVARNNAFINKVDVRFVLANILKHKDWTLGFDDSGFDIIVSNPPYVRVKEKKSMKPNVLNNEPHAALFVQNNDPLLFYREIMDFSIDFLKDKGKVFFEINENLGQEMIDLVEKYDFEVTLRRDIFGKDRMIKAIKS